MKWIKIIIVILIIIALFLPTFHFKKRVKPFGVLLIDGSKSMKGQKIPKINLPIPFKKLYFNKGQYHTCIGDGLLDCIKKYPYASLIILFSDGANNCGKDPIQVAKGINVPVYTMWPKIHSGLYIEHLYKPIFVRSGDSIHLYINFYAGDGATLEVISEKKRLHKEFVRNSGSRKIVYLPEKRSGILKGVIRLKASTTESLRYSVRIMPPLTISLIFGKPDWNVKFLRYYFIEKGYRVIDSLNTNAILYVFINPSIEQINELEKILKKGKKVIYVENKKMSFYFSPILAPRMDSTIFQNQFVYHYLYPSGILPGAIPIFFKDLQLGYLYRMKKGTIFQFSIVDIYKFRLTAMGLLGKNLLNPIMDRVLSNLGVFIKEIQSPSSIPIGAEFNISFLGGKPNKFYIDKNLFPVYSDTIRVKGLGMGKHKLTAIFGSDTVRDSIAVRGSIDEFGSANPILLKNIAEITGGRPLKNDTYSIDKGFKIRERIIEINLSHNIIFYLIIILLLSGYWYLWMKRR